MNSIDNVTFGVEIETTIPVASNVRIGGYHAGLHLSEATNTSGAAVVAPTFSGARWKAEQDGSIMVERNDHKACEFVSPILRGEAGLVHLLEFLAFLRDIGASVNRSCGLHIHIGLRSVCGGAGEEADYIDRLARLVGFNSKALYAQTGTILRELSCFCAPLGDNAKKAVRRIKRTKSLSSADAIGRYQILNLTNLQRTGTVEFRCFAGTINPAKVLLHLFSVLALCFIARKTQSASSWKNVTLTGTKALTNFLKVRPMRQIVSSPSFDKHWHAMLHEGFRLAGKYDLAVASADAAILARVANS